jgi:predicted tellurium resistance membrane protein TerC
MDWLVSPDVWVALLTLTALEIVLGIDNVIFISILAGKLPAHQQDLARRGGLGLALVSRVLLLFSLSWVIGLTAPLFALLGREVSGRDLILLVGGLFLVGKATYEIHERLEGEEAHGSAAAVTSLASVLVQIMLLDVVFSIDSVITAVGMVDSLGVMIAAVVISVGVMLVSAGAIGGFVNRHPSIKMLALSFLLLIGMSLIAEGFHHHIPKGYIYSAMAFSVFVELLNLFSRPRAREPVHLRAAYATDQLPPQAGTVGATALPGTARPDLSAPVAHHHRPLAG